jgi:hypothetical protein
MINLKIRMIKMYKPNTSNKIARSSKRDNMTGLIKECKEILNF